MCYRDVATDKNTHVGWTSRVVSLLFALRITVKKYNYDARGPILARLFVFGDSTVTESVLHILEE